MRSLPPCVPAATLSGAPSYATTATIVDDIIRGRIKVLFVSPERLVSPSFKRLFASKWNADKNIYERNFPEISLLCIDEAHCLSQWAHNFRPCFLRLKGVLDLMRPKGVLAITATAGPRVIADISNTLGISEFGGDYPSQNLPSLINDAIRIMKSDRDNIDVSSLIVGNNEERLTMVRILRLFLNKDFFHFPNFKCPPPWSRFSSQRY